MSIRGVLDNVFRFSGGFAVTQLFLPTFIINSKGGLWVNNANKSYLPSSSSSTSSSSTSSSYSLSSLFPKENAMNDLTNNSADTTLKIIEFITPPAVSKLIEKGWNNWQITHRTLTEDIEYWKHWNRWLTMSLVFAVVWGGGVFSISGAATSLYLTGPNGTERYIRIKKWWRKNISSA